MKMKTLEEQAEYRQMNNLHFQTALCPYCLKELVKVPCIWSEKDETFVCRKCYDKKENIGGKN